MSLPLLALDGSAVFAILLDEPEAARCRETMRAADKIILSAGSLTEMLVVAAGKDVSHPVADLLNLIRPEIVPLTEERALAASQAYRRWGKGFHAARLNICDTFAYALAIEFGCPLLFVGNDFAQTDIVSALPAESW